MDIVMRQTMTESINGGRTTQEFVKGGTYTLPDDVGQLWIGRGWAIAADVAPVSRVAPPTPPKGKE